MDNKVIFLHNQAINYRVPLFLLLEEHFGNKLEFWFYNEENKTSLKNARYFSFFRLKIVFSFSVIINLLLVRNVKAVLIAGSSSYELPFIYLVCKLRRFPILMWTETWDWKSFSYKEKFFLRVIKRIARSSEYVIYAGTKVKELFLSLNISSDKMFFAPNSSLNPKGEIDKEFISKEINPEKQKTVIGFIGRALTRKGIIYLIKAFNKLPEDKFQLIVVMGQGELEYESICKSLIDDNKNIRLLNYLPKEKVNSALAAIDIFVYPSINYKGISEAWGLILNEAVFMNKRIVTTYEVAASYDLVKEGKNGFIVEEKDVESLKEAILKAVQIPSEVVDKTSDELKTIFTYENMAKGFIQPIEKFLK